MGKAYSDDLRRRVVAAMAAGRSCRDVGAAFDVAPSTAGNWYRRYRRENSHAAWPMGGNRRSTLLEQAGCIGEHLAKTPELTLSEIRSELAQGGIEVSGISDLERGDVGRLFDLTKSVHHALASSDRVCSNWGYYLGYFRLRRALFFHPF